MKSISQYSLLVICVLLTSCGSIKSTLQNVDNNAPKPRLKGDAFVLTETATDKKYGYNKDFPINLGFENEKVSEQNVAYFFNALAGPKGEKILYIKTESCCPFPSKRNKMGAGTLDVYEITFEGSSKKVQLYLNVYERGKVLCPAGFTIKK